MYKLVNACKQSEKITYGSPTLYMYLGVSDYRVERCFFKSVFFWIILLALSDEAILFTLTPGNDYFMLVFMWLTLGQTELIHTLNVLPIYSLNYRNYFLKIRFNCNVWEITLLKPWDSRGKHETWQVCSHVLMSRTEGSINSSHTTKLAWWSSCKQNGILIKPVLRYFKVQNISCRKESCTLCLKNGINKGLMKSGCICLHISLRIQ